MPRILAPLLSATTYARWLHLVIGLVFVGVVLMVYPGVEGWSSGELLARAVPVDAALLGLAALVPAMRRAEGVQARLLLVPDREQDIAVEPARGWADRRRTAAWLVGRVVLGGLVGGASVLVPAAVFDLVARPGQAVFGLRSGGEGRAGGPGWAPLLAPVLLFALGWLVVWAGRLQLAMAVRLLGPSPAERLAAAELRAERLLERNLLARELHDSIGHALTVTVLQAGAAREVGDPVFAAKALEVIEETGRRAMDDLERTLALLRDPGDQDALGTPGHGPGGEDARERPGIDRLPALFETARAAGSPVEARVDVLRRPPRGALPRELPDRAGGRHQRPQVRARGADQHPDRRPGRRPGTALRQRPPPARQLTGPVGRLTAPGRQGTSGHPRTRRPAGRRGHGGRRVRRVGADRSGAPTLGRVTIDILLADDEELVRAGLRVVLEAQGDLRVVGEATDGAEAIALARRLRPHVVLMDVRMPGLDGLAATRELVRDAAAPGGYAPKILVVTTFEIDDYVYQALRAGADGFLLKRTRPSEIAQAVRLVAAGESLLFPAQIRRLAAARGNAAARGTMARAALTERETEVLRLVARGLTNGEIAEQLFLGVQTVKTHVSSLLAKLGARDRTQAVILAYESGFVTPAE